MTLTNVFVPPAKPSPEELESEIKLGAPELSAAVQLSGSPPVLLIVKGWVLMPEETLKVSEVGATDSTGGAMTLRVMATACGLLTIAMPLSTAEMEMEPLYCPAASEAEVTETVKVVEPWVMLTEEGETDSQLPPVGVAFKVTLPVQVPVMPIEKVWFCGFVPASVLKVSAFGEGACKVQGGCTTSVTVMVCGVPMCCPVMLSVVLMVIEPL